MSVGAFRPQKAEKRNLTTGDGSSWHEILALMLKIESISRCVAFATEILQGKERAPL